MGGPSTGNQEGDVILYWLTSSKQDFQTAEILFKNKRYHHALFFCHLSVEKMLKALVVYATKTAPPLIHDLVRLAEKADLSLTQQYKNDLAEITTFNIETRYDDYKLSFYKQATQQFSSKYLKKTKRILTWLNKYFIQK